VEHDQEIKLWLSQGLKELDIDLGQKTILALIRYFHILLLKNKSVNLISSKMPLRDMVAVHLLDSLTALKWKSWPAEGLALDLGSGGGLPAVPLSLAKPAWAFTLAEATAKKAIFLAEVKESLGLNNVTVVNDFLKAGLKADGFSFDLVSARAVGELKKLMPLAAASLKNGGLFLAFKGPRGEEELSAAQSEIKKRKMKLLQRIDLTLPLVQAERHLYLFEKQ
jgi:16S rRNA (guanine527-N7)-methyltransferase